MMCCRLVLLNDKDPGRHAADGELLMALDAARRGFNGTACSEPLDELLDLAPFAFGVSGERLIAC